MGADVSEKSVALCMRDYDSTGRVAWRSRIFPTGVLEDRHE